MFQAGFESVTTASDRPQTVALNRSASGIGWNRTRDFLVCSTMSQLPHRVPAIYRVFSLFSHQAPVRYVIEN